MTIYIMLTRVNDGAAPSPMALCALEQDLENAIEEACPEVEWLGNFAVSGPYNYLDIFDAPTPESAMKVSALTKTIGCAHTEMWIAMEWTDYKRLIRDLPMREVANGGDAVELECAESDVTEETEAAASTTARNDMDQAISAVAALNPTSEEVEAAVAMASGAKIAASISPKSLEIYRIMTGRNYAQDATGSGLSP